MRKHRKAHKGHSGTPEKHDLQVGQGRSVRVSHPNQENTGIQTKCADKDVCGGTDLEMRTADTARPRRDSNKDTNAHDRLKRVNSSKALGAVGAPKTG